MRVARRSRPRRCRTLAGLGDDPYRALAGYAEDENAFDKDRQSYFIEFHWARYFGERMHWRPISRATLPDDLKQALRLACEPAARSCRATARTARAEE